MDGQSVEILILVKAAPQPSTTYGETVCVAGLLGPAERPTWIRLYPVPFRYLDGDRQFGKYQLIQVTTRSAGGDKRRESHKIVADSIAITGSLSTWARRSAWIERLDTPTMCSLQEAVKPRPKRHLARRRPPRPTGAAHLRTQPRLDPRPTPQVRDLPQPGQPA